MMNQTLDGLRSWHDPAPPGWWPPAPGWWVLAVLVLVLLGWAWHLWRAHRARQAPARAALAELAALRKRCRGAADRRACLAALAALLRRVALAYHPREQVGGLSGLPWLAFLDATGGEGAFAKGAGRGLIEAALRPEAGGATEDAQALWSLAERWIRAQGRAGRSTTC